MTILDHPASWTADRMSLQVAYWLRHVKITQRNMALLGALLAAKSRN